MIMEFLKEQIYEKQLTILCKGMIESKPVFVGKGKFNETSK